MQDTTEMLKHVETMSGETKSASGVGGESDATL